MYASYICDVIRAIPSHATSFELLVSYSWYDRELKAVLSSWSFRPFVAFLVFTSIPKRVIYPRCWALSLMLPRQLSYAIRMTRYHVFRDG